jgi:mRNA interferase RelE/StbE
MAVVRLTAGAIAQFAALPRVVRERVQRVLNRLQKWPAVSGAKPLSGNLAGWYRLRTGDYRIRFHVQGELVIVDRIGHRKDVYDD